MNQSENRFYRVAAGGNDLKAECMDSVGELVGEPWPPVTRSVEQHAAERAHLLGADGDKIASARQHMREAGGELVEAILGKPMRVQFADDELRPKLKVKRVHPDAKLPQYMTAGAACFDVHAVDDGVTQIDCANTFSTGLAFEVPAGHVMLVYSRSGHGFNHDVRLANCVGVIDSDYRGELRVRLTSDAEAFEVRKGDRIAQCMLLPVQQWALMEVDELSDTARGDGACGSTGR
jgi:dUTP pyrophosphatase